MIKVFQSSKVRRHMSTSEQTEMVRVISYMDSVVNEVGRNDQMKSLVVAEHESRYTCTSKGE